MPLRPGPGIQRWDDGRYAMLTRMEIAALVGALNEESRGQDLRLGALGEHRPGADPGASHVLLSMTRSSRTWTPRPWTPRPWPGTSARVSVLPVRTAAAAAEGGPAIRHPGWAPRSAVPFLEWLLGFQALRSPGRVIGPYRSCFPPFPGGSRPLGGTRPGRWVPEVCW